MEAALRVAVKGDWGFGSRAQRDISQQMCREAGQRPFQAVATTGDNFYRPDGVATTNNYFGPEQCLINRPGHVWRATWGNHDAASDSTRTVLGAEHWYTWSAGPADFFMLDSNQAASPEQTRWLASALEGSSAESKIAAFHHPPFTAGKHENNRDVAANWVPLFESRGVDLVLSGHNHAYEHSLVNNVHYVISGGGGAPVYPCLRDEPWLLKCRVAYHFLVLEIGSTQISVRAVDQAGSVVDEFKIAV